MKRIDFLGAPGVGKTTLYNELASDRNNQFNFLTPDETKYVLAKRKLISKKKTLKDWYKFLLLNSHLYKFTTPDLVDIILKNDIDEYMWSNDFSKFLYSAIQNMNVEEKSIVHRIIGTIEFYNKVSEILYLESFNLRKKVIYDESILHGIFTLLYYKNKNKSEDIVKNYFGTVELPEIAIYCKAPVKKIVERIIIRKKKTNKLNKSHRDNRELYDVIKFQTEMLEYALEILKRRKLEILEIDMGTDVKQNSRKIAQLLKE